jgi:hypothetical protein
MRCYGRGIGGADGYTAAGGVRRRFEERCVGQDACRRAPLVLVTKKPLGSGMLAGTSRVRNAREALVSAPQCSTPLATTRECATLPDDPRLASCSTRRLVCITDCSHQSR